MRRNAMSILLTLAIFSMLTACPYPAVGEAKDETGDTGGSTICFQDLDSDGYGNPAVSHVFEEGYCNPAAGWVTDNTDCADVDYNTSGIYPGATEYCNGRDEDCDGEVDESHNGVPPEASTLVYLDADGDGYGSDDHSFSVCDTTNYAQVAGDCDDHEATINPGASETCDYVDNNCDGQVDEGLAGVWFDDVDGDGYGDPSVILAACTQPYGYVTDNTDCNDDHDTVYPGATEICDELDNDCDGMVDEGVQDSWYADVDRDGYGNPDAQTGACNQPNGYVADNTDSDDTNAAVYPGAPEICDGLDNDDNGLVDDNATDALTWYIDVDGDYYGDINDSTLACTAPVGYVADATDCDDTRANVYPAASEYCNGLDDNCDGVIDENTAVDAMTWYTDRDNDTYGDDSTATVTCSQPQGTVVLRGSDCNDKDPRFHPLASEPCGTDDFNCDGVITTVPTDADGDGYSNCGDPTQEHPIDCNDGDAAINVDANETCDSIDNNCNGVIDENAAVDATTWYVDSDSDGSGDILVITPACDQPIGYVADSSDCDDTNSLVRPGANEYCDGIDNNCDGAVDENTAVDAATWYEDVDGDGYGDSATAFSACVAPTDTVADATDCDDTNPNTSPVASEYCDGLDNDCDSNIDEASAVDAATWYVDGDGDGYGNGGTQATVACNQPAGTVADASDCDDTNPNRSPDADEVCDGVDNDCNGSIDETGALGGLTWYADMDNDGYGNLSVTAVACNQPSGFVANGTDCNDANSTVRPGANESCNGIDDDCDGTVDENGAPAVTWYVDADGDGYGNSALTQVSCTQPSGYVLDRTDCDDAATTTNPAAAEYCDGHDDDCDGTVDEDTAVDAVTWYADADVDGYGDPAVSTTNCVQPADYVSDATDCDDADPDVNPIATEICNGVDDDCDGVNLTTISFDTLVAEEVVITEIMSDPASLSDSSGEWFELYNASGCTVSLTPFVIQNASGSERQTVGGCSTTTIQPDGFFALTVNLANPVFGCEYYWYSTSFGASDSLQVLTAGGTVLDTVVWTSATIGVSWSLDPSALDATMNDTVANWCNSTSAYYTGDYGTPGADNDSCN